MDRQRYAADYLELFCIYFDTFFNWIIKNDNKPGNVYNKDERNFLIVYNKHLRAIECKSSKYPCITHYNL